MSALTASMSLLVNAAPMAPAAPQSAPADNGFARCLDQARDSNNDVAPADEAPQRPGVKKPPPNTRAERDARAGRTSGTPETQPKPERETETHADAATTDTAHDDSAAPDLATLLPGWAPPVVSAPITAAAADDGAPLQAGAAIGGANAPTALSQGDAAARALAQLAAACADADQSAAITTTASAELQAAATEQRIEARELQSTPLPTPLPNTPATATTTAFKAADAPPPTAMLPAAIDSPAFAPTLATQVRWWASDGVQQAQLQLNPAEMGPVTVKIVVLDGRETRIDFSADLAATRSAIEAALPVLAAALDDGGLKLTGGGVHDGSAQQQAAWSAHETTHRTATRASMRDDGRDDERATRPAAAPARGIVDLVA
jgi:flagellar hook-length control protein FliK